MNQSDTSTSACSLLINTFSSWRPAQPLIHGTALTPHAALDAADEGASVPLLSPATKLPASFFRSTRVQRGHNGSSTQQTTPSRNALSCEVTRRRYLTTPARLPVCLPVFSFTSLHFFPITLSLMISSTHPSRLLWLFDFSLFVGSVRLDSEFQRTATRPDLL